MPFSKDKNTGKRAWNNFCAAIFFAFILGLIGYILSGAEEYVAHIDYKNAKEFEYSNNLGLDRIVRKK